MTDPVVIAAVRARWCRDSAGHRPQASADRRPYASTPSPAGNSADYSPSAGAEQTTPERALAGEASCSDLLQRITAARGAINGLMAEVLEEHCESIYRRRTAVPSRAKPMRPRS